MGDSLDSDAELRNLLRTLSPSAREHFREVLIQDQADRDAIDARLLRYRDERGTAWANLVDRLSLDPLTLSSVAGTSGCWGNWKPNPPERVPP
jgi:hypothetical protein